MSGTGDLGRTVRLFTRFTAGQRRSFVLATLLLVVDALTAVAVPNLIKYLTDFLTSDQRPSLLGLSPSHDATIPVIAAAIVAATALNSSSESLADISLATAARTLGFNLRGALFAHLQRLPLAFHLRRGTGDVLTRLTGDVTAMEDFVEDSVSDLVGSVLIVVATLVSLFVQSWQVGLLAVVIVPLLTVVSNFFARRIKSASKQQRASEGDLASTAQEMLSTVSLVQVYGRADREERRFEIQSRSARDAFVRTARLDAFFGFTVAVVQSLGIAVVILFGARLVTGGTLTAGQLIAFILLIENMFKPVRRIIKQWNRVAGVYASVERVGDLLDLRATVVDSPDARPVPPLRGEIEFRDVSFAYEPLTSGPDGPIGRLALDSLSFRIAAGESVALVGQSGAGKSTIAQLLPRLYDPHAGAVLVDGHDIRSFTLDSLRLQISMVLQETLLLRGTVAENIAYGRDGATREDVVTAARQAAAHDFVMALPDGYDTVLGERAATLSGGQRQRLAVARAFIRNSPILILDEPTTGLDADSAALVADSLRVLTRNRSTLIVSHDLNLIRDVDRVLVISAGRILEDGSPADLLASGGLYAELYARQFGEAVAASASAPSTGAPAAEGDEVSRVPAARTPETAELLGPTGFGDQLTRAMPRPATRAQFRALTGWVPAAQTPSPDDDLDPLRNPAVARALPGLADALSAETMAPELRRMLAEGWELSTCEVHKAFLHGAEGATLLYRLQLRRSGETAEHLVGGRLSPTADATERWAVRADAQADRLDGREDMRAFARPVLGLREAGLVLHAFPLDPGLPGLLVATDALSIVEMFGPVLTAAVPGLALEGGRAGVVRYRPDRCVLRYELSWRLHHRGRSLKQILYGTVYADDRGRQVGPLVTALRASPDESGSSLPFLVPRFQAYLPDAGLALLDAVPGAPLLPALIRNRTSGAIPPALAACARVAAAFHRTSLPVTVTRTLPGAVDEAWAAVDALAPLAPGLAASLRRALSAVGNGALDPPGRLRAVHGDFHPSQVLFDGQTASLLGFDRACVADPALDLGEFTAHLTAAVPAGTDAEGTARAAEDLVSLFLRNYLEEGTGEADDGLPARVAAYRTVALVRLAVRRWSRIQPQRLRSVLARLDRPQRIGVS